MPKLSEQNKLEQLKILQESVECLFQSYQSQKGIRQRKKMKMLMRISQQLFEMMRLRDECVFQNPVNHDEMDYFAIDYFIKQVRDELIEVFEHFFWPET